MALDESRIASVRVARQQELSESLSAMRLEGKSDVCFVCQETQFFAHKIILGSASPYFATMFSTELEESKSGRVVFDETDPDALDCILDFIYLGAVEKIKTEEQLKEVLKSSHLMQLDKLVQYCCDVLTDMLSVDNFFELMHLSEIYALHKMQIKVRQLWISNGSKLTATDNFLSLPVDGLKELLNSFQGHLFCLDETLAGVLKWVSHEGNLREKFASELLQLFDGNFLSKDFVKELLASKVMKHSSIAAELIKLAVVSLSSDNCLSKQISLAESNNLSWATTLTFVSGNYNVKAFDPLANIFHVLRSDRGNCLQQFNLSDMTWMPLKHANFGFEYNTCYLQMYQFKHYIQFYCSEYTSCTYNMLSNSYHLFRRRWTNDAACLFKKLIFLIGSKEVKYVKPLSLESFPCPCLDVKVESQFVLASTQFIYLIGINEEFTKELVIQYGSNPAGQEKWEVTRLFRKGINSDQFSVYNNTLNAFYFGVTENTHVMFNHDNKKWEVKKRFFWPESETEALVLSKFQNPECPFIFFSRRDDYLRIPFFKWEPESGMWSKLPPPKGECDIPNSPGVRMLYYLEN